MRRKWMVLGLVFALSTGCGGSDDHVDRMSEEHKNDTPDASPAAMAEPVAAVEAERVVYAEHDGAQVTGLLARPAEGAADAPGVIVIHEWWGLNENIESMARQLAGEGYLALAVDLYGGRVAEDRDAARALMTEAGERREVLEQNLRGAHAYLESQGAPKTGSIGWCFGGGWSLQAAILLPDQLDAAVIYYGRIETDRERLATLTAPILGHFGSEDGGIPIEGVRELESALAELGKSAEIHVYEGADHAFANPSGTRYDAAAAEQAWERTRAFFAEHLKD